MERHVAIYMRVSTAQQDTRSQEPDLKSWIEAYAKDQPVVWYVDRASGKTMNRPEWQRLEDNMAKGYVSKVDRYFLLDL